VFLAVPASAKRRQELRGSNEAVRSISARLYEFVWSDNPESHKTDK
jgi:hypothetical protein